MGLSVSEKFRIVTARILLIILAPLHSLWKSRVERSTFVRSAWDPAAKQRQFVAIFAVAIAIAGITWAGASITGNVAASKNMIEDLTEELDESKGVISGLSVDKNRVESDLAQCNSQFLTCNNDLSICSTELSNKNTDLNSCTTDKGKVQNDLDSMTTERNTWKNNFGSLETDSAKRLCGCPVPGNGETRSYNVTSNNTISCSSSGVKTVTC